MGNVDESQFDKYFFNDAGQVMLKPTKEKEEKKQSNRIVLDDNMMFTSEKKPKKDEKPALKEKETNNLSKRKYWDEWNDDGIAIRHYLEPGETEKQSRKKVKEERKRQEKEKKQQQKEEEERKKKEERQKREEEKKAREEEKSKKSDTANNAAVPDNNANKISILKGDGIEYIERTPSSAGINATDKPKEKKKPMLLDGPLPNEKKSGAPDKQAQMPTAKIELEKAAAQKPRKDLGVIIL